MGAKKKRKFSKRTNLDKNYIYIKDLIYSPFNLEPWNVDTHTHNSGGICAMVFSPIGVIVVEKQEKKESKKKNFLCCTT